MHLKDFGNVPIMWVPEKDCGKLVAKFRKIIEDKYKGKIDNYWDFHKWTVEHVPEFWAEMWDFTEIICSKPFEQVIDMKAKLSTSPEWFRGARLNFAENLLKYRDDHIALISAGEDKGTKYITYENMYEEACVYGSALRRLGVKKDDRVVCYMSNREEPIFAMLGTTSIGAVWSGALPLLGAKAALNRFKQIEPKVLFTIDRFLNDGEEKEMLSKVEEIVQGLPSLEKVVIVPSKKESKNKDISNIKNSCFLDDFLALGRNSDNSVNPLQFEQLPFSHPVFISYTSGTTGTPKAMIHGIGGLLTMSRDFWLHSDGTRADTWLSMSPVGWASWNMLAAMHFLGVAVVLFEGVPFYLSPSHLWDMVDKFKISNLFLTPSTLDELEKRGYLPTEKNHLISLRVIMSGASVVKPQNYDFVYKKIKTDIIFGNVYGSTELMGSCMTIDSTLPIHKGEITAPSFGIDLQCYDDNGKALSGEVGELVVRTPTPSLPLALWGDKDGSLYRKTYFSKYQDVFTPGDLCTINPITRGIYIHGRSDDTLKPKGCRFGSSEIYNIVDTIPEVRDSICVSQYSKDRDERAVLFLKMRNNQIFTEQLVQRIRDAIKRELSARHVPEVILHTDDIPHNMNGKKMEVIVKKIINGMPYNPETVINPECLANFENVPELQNF